MSVSRSGEHIRREAYVIMAVQGRIVPSLCIFNWEASDELMDGA